MNKLPVELIRESVSPLTLGSLASIETFREIGSTNTYLLEAENPAPGFIRVVIAEQQTAGRGRRDKKWYSPPGAGLWMSIAYTFVAAPTNLSALTLAIGVTLADEFSMLGVGNISLKWPNDLLVGDRKLGGILLESCAGGMTAVVGIGINLLLPDDASRHIEGKQSPIDLDELLPSVPSLESLAAQLIERLLTALQKFDRDGFDSFAEACSKFDAMAGRKIVVQQEGLEETGTAQGIGNDGALMLRTDQGLHRIVSGSIRFADGEDEVA